MNDMNCYVEDLKKELVYMPFFFRDAKRLIPLLKKIAESQSKGITITELESFANKSQVTLSRNFKTAEKWGLIEAAIPKIGAGRTKPRKLTKKGEHTLLIFNKWDREGWPETIYPEYILRPQDKGTDNFSYYLMKLKIPSDIINYIANKPLKKKDYLNFLEYAIEKMIQLGYYDQWKKKYFDEVVDIIFP